MKNKLHKKIIESISRKKVRPKYFFVVRNLLIWTVGVLAFLAGSLSVAAGIFIIVNAGLRMPAPHVTAIVPYIWMMLLLLFMVLAEAGIRKTKNGYKYSLKQLMAYHLVATLALGSGLYFLGAGYQLDKVTARAIPPYHAVADQKISRISNLEQGVLAGRIIERVGDNEVMVQGPAGNIWTLVLVEQDMNSQIALKKSGAVIAFGEGFEDTFEACRVWPLVLRGGPRNFPKQKNALNSRYLDNGERNIARVRNIECDLAR